MMVSLEVQGKAADLFTEAVISFTAGEHIAVPQLQGRSYAPYPPTDAAQFSQRVQKVLGLYDWQINLVQLNLLDSHDTSRLLSIARGDKATVRLATLFQMTFPGAPSVYYGDEIGLRGAPDPEARYQDRFARWTFPWDRPAEWDRDLLQYFKAAIALRHSHPALRRGEFIPLYGQGNVFAFARHDDGETLLVALNVGNDAETVSVPVGGYWKNGATLQTLLTSDGATAGDEVVVKDGQTALKLPAREGVVLGGK